MTPRHKSTVALLAAFLFGVLLLIAAAPEGQEDPPTTTWHVGDGDAVEVKP